jgi:hypothetical protein
LFAASLAVEESPPAMNWKVLLALLFLHAATLPASLPRVYRVLNMILFVIHASVSLMILIFKLGQLKKIRVRYPASKANAFRNHSHQIHRRRSWKGTAILVYRLDAVPFHLLLLFQQKEITQHPNKFKIVFCCFVVLLFFLVSVFWLKDELSHVRKLKSKTVHQFLVHELHAQQVELPKEHATSSSSQLQQSLCCDGRAFLQIQQQKILS